MTRYVFITGGVVSSLGKGLAAAALGALLQQRGYLYQAIVTFLVAIIVVIRLEMVDITHDQRHGCAGTGGAVLGKEA